MIFNSSHKHGFAGSSIEQPFKQKCGGRLAVGSRNACDGQFSLRMTEEGSRSLGQRTPTVFNFEDRQARFKHKQVIEPLRGVSDDAQRARGKSLVNVAIAVGRVALHGHKH